MKVPTMTVAAALCALLALPLASCGSASASPLEVTYYYLPG